MYICTGEKITASIFPKLDSRSISKLKLSVGGRVQVCTLLDEIKAGRKSELDTYKYKRAWLKKPISFGYIELAISA